MWKLSFVRRSKNVKSADFSLVSVSSFFYNCLCGLLPAYRQCIASRVKVSKCFLAVHQFILDRSVQRFLHMIPWTSDRIHKIPEAGSSIKVEADFLDESLVPDSIERLKNIREHYSTIFYFFECLSQSITQWSWLNFNPLTQIENQVCELVVWDALKVASEISLK